MKKIILAAATLAAMMSGAAADSGWGTGDLGDSYGEDSGVVRPTPPPRPSTGGAGTVGAVGVCCSDGVPQVSSVTIATATPPTNISTPPSGGLGGGEDDGPEGDDFSGDNDSSNNSDSAGAGGIGSI